MSSAVTAESRPGTLVLGLGNPILGDDGIGWRVVEALERRLGADPDARSAVGGAELDRMAVGGLALMERMVGYQRVILADAILDGDPPGTVSVRPLAEVACRLAGHLDNAHGTPLTGALSAGRALGAAAHRDHRGRDRRAGGRRVRPGPVTAGRQRGRAGRRRRHRGARATARSRLMHEMGITRRNLEVALERAAAAGASRITEVHLEIGEESDVAPASVEHYWPEVSRATPAEGARLVGDAADDPWACRLVAIDIP